MTEIVGMNSQITESVSRVGENSAVFVNGTLVTRVNDVVAPAAATETIYGVSNEAVTLASDNETVDMVKVSYTDNNDSIRIKVAASAAITIDDELKFYDITTAGLADVATESATTGQLQLIKFVDQANSIFAIANA